jgi:hypothetical protein
MKKLVHNSKFATTTIILFCLFFVANAFGQSGTVTSGASGNWNSDATWVNININRTGTITCATGSTTVTGTSTLFLTQLTVGSVITSQGGTTVGTVASITNNTSLTLTVNASNNLTNSTYRTTAGPPSPVDTVIVDDLDDVTVNLNSVCAALTINTGGNDSNLIISGTNSLAVTGAITINNGTGNGDNKYIEVGTGTLSCASVVIADTTNDNRDSEIRISTGTVNVTGNITMNGSAARNAIRFTGSGILNIGGNMTGGSLVQSTGTVNYNGSGAQNIGAYTYYNLTTSTSGTKTLNANITVTNKLSIQGTSVLVANAAGRINDTAPIELNGGTYRTGATAGFTDTAGVLTLSENSNLILGTGNHTLTFANSNAASWVTGKTLTITGWVGGYNGTAASGTNPKLFVGTAATHLTAAQLNQISFFDGTNNYGGILLSTGELVPNGIPKVTSFSPTAVCQSSTITINGAGFIGVTAVRVNGGNVQSYTVNSSNSITATLTAGQTTGLVTVVNPNGTGTSSSSITVSPIPTAVTAVASAAAICIGGSVDLTSSVTSNSATATILLSQNFNGTPTGWTTTNTSTGGTPANAAWTLRADGYNYNSGTIFNSNDASQFYLSNSDAQGSAGITATTLQSPSFSTLGMSAASLNFFQYYRYNGTETAVVQVSTDGSNWVDLNTAPTATIGTRTGFVSTTLSLAAYLNQPTVSIRFKYDCDYDWYWAIDNVTVTSTPITPAISYAWTSTPTGYTSSTQNPTGVSPSVATTYTVTTTNNYGCSAANTTATVTVNAQPTGPTLNVKSPNLAAVCSGTAVSATFTSGSGGTGCSDDYTVSIDGGAATVYTPGTSVGGFATSSIVIQGRRASCTSGAGCTGTSYVTLASWTVNAVFTSGGIGTSGETICFGTDPTLGINSAAAASGGDNAITYKWQANGLDIPGSDSDTFDPPPGLTVTTTYTRYAKDNTCNPTFTLSSGSWVVTISNDNTWTGATSTAWTTASNWSCGVVPASVSDVTISAATFYPEISSNVTINTLTLDSGTTLKVNSTYDLTVTDVIDNDGTLTIENSANLLQDNDVANTGSGSTIVQRNTNPLIRFDYTLWSSPVSGQNLFDFSPLTSVSPNIRFYTYNSTINSPATTGFYQSVAAYATTDFALGKGYLIRLPFNHPTAAAIWNGQFTGVPNNGTPSPSVAITDSGDRFNAVGNPYPSAISIAQFASDNSANIETSLYFWRKTNNSSSPSYCSWNTATSTYGDNGEANTESPLGVIQTGQGFFVQAKTGANTLVFNNGQRIGDNANQFFRTPVSTTTIEANRIWLNMTGATSGFSQSVIGYFTNATVDADDTDTRYFNDGPIALTSTIANQDYVIQGRPVPFDTADVVPMKYKVTTAGNFTIAIGHVDGLFSAGQTVYLRDNLTSVVHNLTTGGYTFASGSGTFDSRFEVVYALPLGTETPLFTANNVIIYSQNNEFVVNSGTIIMSSIKVFDILGRLLEEKKGINAYQTTVGSGLANEVLLVQITSEDGITVTKKVIR